MSSLEIKQADRGPNVKHSSESNEHFTPEYVVEPGRRVLGGFELDPASCKEANRLVRAARIFTREDNGYLRAWDRRGDGTALVNPPGGVCDVEGRGVIRASKRAGRRACWETGECGLPPGHKHLGVTSSLAAWYAKTCMEHRVRGWQSFFIGFSVELLQTAQTWDVPHPLEFPCVFPHERIPFDTWNEETGERESGEQPTHASVLVFVVSRGDWKWTTEFLNKLDDEFGELGHVHVPRSW